MSFIMLCTNNEEPICKWQKNKIKIKTKNSKNLIPNTFIIEYKSIGLASILVGTICEHPIYVNDKNYRHKCFFYFVILIP